MVERAFIHGKEMSSTCSKSPLSKRRRTAVSKSKKPSIQNPELSGASGSKDDVDLSDLKSAANHAVQKVVGYFKGTGYDGQANEDVSVAGH